MSQSNEILSFIKRRFPSDCHWTDGNCYYFSLILCSRFPNLQIFYEPILGHFVAGDGAHFYDFNGEFFNYKKLILLDDIAKEDTLWYDRIVRDCIL